MARTLILGVLVASMGCWQFACRAGTASQAAPAVQSLGTPERSERGLLVLIPGPTDELSFSQALYTSAMALQAEGHDVAVVAEAATMARESLLELIERHHRQGRDIAVAAGGEFAQLITELAARHPERSYATLVGHADGARVISYCLDCIPKGGFMAGLIAARLTRNQVVGFVGGVEAVDGPEGKTFEQGVGALAPTARVLVEWTQSWFDDEQAVALARSMLERRADVLVADASAAVAVALRGAAQTHVIGWMSDISSLDRERVAASITIDTRHILRDVLARVAEGRYPGSPIIVDDSYRLWHLAGTNPAIPEATWSEIRALIESTRCTEAGCELAAP